MKSEQKGGGGGGSRKGIRVSAPVLKALTHGVRREALRLLHEAGEPKSAIQLTKSIPAPGTKISYHLRVLEEAGVIGLASERLFKGFSEKFFASAVESNALILSILAQTYDDDCPFRK